MGILTEFRNTATVLDHCFNPYPANVDNMASSYQC